MPVRRSKRNRSHLPSNRKEAEACFPQRGVCGLVGYDVYSIHRVPGYLFLVMVMSGTFSWLLCSCRVPFLGCYGHVGHLFLECYGHARVGTRVPPGEYLCTLLLRHPSQGGFQKNSFVFSSSSSSIFFTHGVSVCGKRRETREKEMLKKQLPGVCNRRGGVRIDCC